MSANMYRQAVSSMMKWLNAIIVADHLSRRLCISRVPENLRTAEEAHLGSTRYTNAKFHTGSTGSSLDLEDAPNTELRLGWPVSL